MADIWSTIDKMAKVDLQPIASGGCTPPGPPNMTEAKIQAVVLGLRSLEKNNGIAGVAKANGVPVQWAEEVYKLWQKKLGVLQAQEVGEIEPK